MNFFSLFKRNLIYKFKKKIKIDNDNFQFNSIDDLFYYYGSDKSDKIKISDSPGHGYSKFYTKYLENLKNKKNNILEIGSFAGASAASFVKYLPGSKIFCFDINVSNFNFVSKDIHVYGINVANVEKTEEVLKKIFKNYNFELFDIIVDDGSHNLSDMLTSFSTFFKHLKKDGVFVIEDFKFPNYYSYNKNVNDILIDELLNKIKNKEFFDSQIISKEKQTHLFDIVGKIDIYKGNLANSDICFIKKK